MFTFMVNQLGVLTLEAALATAALDTASTQANPLAAGQNLKGWLKAQHYDADDTLILTQDVFGALSVASDVDIVAEGLIKTEFTHRLLHSTLNTLGIS
jgi:hypothetical protein